MEIVLLAGLALSPGKVRCRLTTSPGLRESGSKLDTLNLLSCHSCLDGLGLHLAVYTLVSL